MRTFPPALRKKYKLDPLFTLTPFPGNDLTWAVTEAGKLGIPFLEISPDGLEFTADRLHLTAKGRAKATASLLGRLDCPTARVNNGS